MEANPEEFSQHHMFLVATFQAVMSADDETVTSALGSEVVEQNRQKEQWPERMSAISLSFMEGFRKLLWHSKAVVDGLVELDQQTHIITEDFKRRHLPLSLPPNRYTEMVKEKRATFLSFQAAMSQYLGWRSNLIDLWPVSDAENGKIKEINDLMGLIEHESAETVKLHDARRMTGIHGSIIEKICGAPLSAQPQGMQTGVNVVDSFNLTAEATGSDLFDASESIQDALSDMLVLYDFLRGYKESNPGLEELDCEDEKRAILEMMEFLREESTRLLDLSSRIGDDMAQIPGLVAH